MRTFLAITAAALLGASFSTVAADGSPVPEAIVENIAEPTTPQNIQVLLEKDAQGALLEVKGSYLLYDPHDGSKISSGILGKRFMIHATAAGLRWGEEFPGIFQFRIQPKSKDTSLFVNGIQYSGNISVYAVGDRINIVNDIDIESYVKGLLSAQFATPVENEVMAALAILARTNAYYTVSRHPDAFWHVAANETGYQGSGLIAPRSMVIKAVESTRHLILVHSEKCGKSLPFATTWTEHSAGKTASYQSMFRKETYAPFGSVEAPHAALSRLEAKWNYTIAKNELARLLEMPAISKLELFTDGASNKVYALRLYDGQNAQDIDFFTFQEKLGKEHLLSSDFSVSIKDNNIIFNGFGKGHGVGLCLYSAAAMAQNGENAVKILSKFFPETYLLNLNAMPEAETTVR